LLDFFGKKGGDLRLRQISADTIAQYQARRIEQGLAGRTVNMEVGLLRARPEEEQAMGADR